MLLLSIKPLVCKTDDMSWDEVANKLNEDTRYPPRSAWDCWHRWVVPWCRSQQPSRPKRNTYPHALGVQHEYKFADLEGLIELWASISGATGISRGVASPHAFPAPKTAAVQQRRAGGRAHHPGAHSAHIISCAGSLCALKRIHRNQHLRMCLAVLWGIPVSAGWLRGSPWVRSIRLYCNAYSKANPSVQKIGCHYIYGDAWSHHPLLYRWGQPQIFHRLRMIENQQARWHRETLDVPIVIFVVSRLDVMVSACFLSI